MLKWVHKLKVAQKLMLVSVVFLIPDSVMLYLFITSINEKIDAARLEQVGNAYQRAAEPLLELIPDHRLRVADKAARPEDLEIARAKIDAALVAVADVDAHIGAELDFTPAGLRKRDREASAIDRVRRDWAALHALCGAAPGGAAAARAIDDRHLDLIAAVRGMIAHAGDTSNLILDPELDSYYLMDVTLLALPQTQDRLAQVVVDALGRLGEADAHASRVALAIHLANLRNDDINRTVGSMRTAMANPNPDYGPNAAFRANVELPLKQYVEANERFCNLVERLTREDVADVSAADVVEAGRAARATSFALWRAANVELDRLLQNRIDHYVFRRARSLAVAGAAALAAALLVTFITRSISGPLKRQADDLRRAVDEALAERRLAEDRLVRQQRAEAELRAAQDRLVTASRHAGMAEVATGVLHNVGNVLNSVNVSVHVIKDAVQGSPIAKLARTADLLDEHRDDPVAFLTNDERGRRVPGFVVKLARLLDAEHAAVAREIDNLARGVEHIKQVVQFQQGYAKRPSTVRERLDPTSLLDEALRLNLIALDRHGVTIEREVEDVGVVDLDKHKTLQILVNLIGNAKQAMGDLNENRERKLTLGLHAVGAAGARRLRVSVGDNGVGIPAENLARIFAHGFTTRADGHGFGLHSAANAAREMDGTLVVHSDGPGRGATFTLEVPIDRDAVATSAMQGVAA